MSKMRKCSSDKCWPACRFAILLTSFFVPLLVQKLEKSMTWHGRDGSAAPVLVVQAFNSVELLHAATVPDQRNDVVRRADYVTSDHVVQVKPLSSWGCFVFWLDLLLE